MRLDFKEIPAEAKVVNKTFSEVDARCLKIHVLASGSKGNATILEDMTTGRALAVDCGICKRAFFDACGEVGLDVAKIEGFLITHEHGDHTKGLGVVLRGMNKLGMRPTVYVGSEVNKAVSEMSKVQDICDVSIIKEGSNLSVAGVTAHVFETSHDAAESFGFRFERGSDVVGYMTDTGIVTPSAFEALKECRVLALESNHDKRMLETGPYPYVLKQRVASDRGHLSNEQAAQALESLLNPKLEQVIAMHISENNNTYRLPWETLEEILKRNDHPAKAISAYQNRIVSI